MTNDRETIDDQIKTMNEQLRTIEAEIVKLLESRNSLKSKIRVLQHQATHHETSEASELIIVSDEEQEK